MASVSLHQVRFLSYVNLNKSDLVIFCYVIDVPSVAEWSKALESDATAGGESPVRAPVRAATLCPLRVVACVFVAGTAQRSESVSGRRGPCPVYRAR